MQNAVTIKVAKQTTADVSFTLGQDADGNVVVFANGEPAVKFTKRGYLQRPKGLSATTGLRRLPDGRVAIRKRRNGAHA